MATRTPQEISRRDLLERGAWVAFGTLLAARLPAAEPAAAGLPLITRVIPASGEKIPAVGIGTDSFRDDVREEIRAELRRMSELGGSVIDTAAAYGDSEALIGQALDTLGTRDRMFIATKLVAGSFAGTGLAPSALTPAVCPGKTNRVSIRPQAG